MRKIKSKIRQAGECRKLFKIEVPKEDMDAVLEKVYRDIQKEAFLPGFRKGNVPMDILRKKYKELAREKAVERVVRDSYREVMRDNDVVPVGAPRINKISFQEAGPLSFEADIEHRPRLNIKNYKGGSIRIKKKTAEVPEEQLKQSLDGLREAAAQYRTIENRQIREGDYVVCDLDWQVDGKSIDKRGGILLPVDNTLSREVLSALKGVTPPARKSVSVNIDNSPRTKEYAGKTAILDIDIRHLQKKELPPLDDDFAKSVGPFDNLKHLEDKVRESIGFENRRSIRTDMENQVIEALLKANVFDVPKSLVESEEKFLTEEAKAKMLQHGFTEEKIHEELSKAKAAIQEHAKKRVRVFFILHEIALKENIPVTQEEYDNFIGVLAQGHSQKPEDMKKYAERHNMADRIHWQIQEAKVKQFLIDEAKVEEERNSKHQAPNSK